LGKESEVFSLVQVIVCDLTIDGAEFGEDHASYEEYVSFCFDRYSDLLLNVF